MKNSQIDTFRVVMFILKTIFALAVAYTLPISAIKSTELSNVLITIFSIFAGFMIALMAMTAHLHDTMNWKEIAVAREVIEARLFRQQLLFYGYLLTLAFIVASLLIENYTLWGFSAVVSEYVRRIYIFIGILSLLLSFSLPSSLKKAHEKNISEQMENKKNRY